MKKHISILAGMLFLITFAVNLQMPLFKAYADKEHYGVGVIGFAFASYTLGLLPAALFLGGLSDRLGRKVVIQLALILSTLSTFIMILFPTIMGLFIARTLVGVSVALGIATGNSYLIELFDFDKEKRAAILMALSTSLGFGGGALATSIVLLIQDTLVPITYPLNVAGSLTLLCLSFLLPKTTKNENHRLIRLPVFPPKSLSVNISIALFWSVTGIAISIIPFQLIKHHLDGWLGLSLFIINGTGAAILPLARRIPESRALLISYILLPIGFSLLIMGSLFGYLVMILAGCAFIGATCYGFGYLGTLSTISKLGKNEKPRAVAGYLLFAYLGFGIPSVAMGISAEKYGLQDSLFTYLLITIFISLFLLLRQILHEKALSSISLSK